LQKLCFLQQDFLYGLVRGTHLKKGTPQRRLFGAQPLSPFALLKHNPEKMEEPTA